MNLRNIQKFAVCGTAVAALLSSPSLKAQHLTLEGQTGGFITPTAYVVYSAKEQFFSYPAVGYHFVNSAIDGKTYKNGDVYVAATKTWPHAPLPFLANIGWKATNASIFGIGGQATRFEGRLFGGLGIPLPGPFGTAIVPAVGFTQEPPQSKNLGALLVGGRSHLPTTLDYAVRVTQKTNPHFAFDIGIGQVAGQVGTTFVRGLGFVPVNLQARKVFGMGLSLRY